MNKIINTIIVDDEPNALRVLSHDLEAFPDIKVIGATTSEDEAKRYIMNCDPDLLFLDMELTHSTGVELLQEIRPFVSPKMHVVFYTAFDKYMIDAIRNAAFDYLVKPYQPAELRELIERVRTHMDLSCIGQQQPLLSLNSDNSKIALQTMTCLKFLRRSEIIYFEYVEDNRSWSVTLHDRTRHRLRTNVKAKDILQISTGFIAINSACIINIDYLASVENQTLLCKLYPPYSDIELVASRRYYSKLKEALEVF